MTYMECLGTELLNSDVKLRRAVSKDLPPITLDNLIETRGMATPPRGKSECLQGQSMLLGLVGFMLETIHDTITTSVSQRNISDAASNGIASSCLSPKMGPSQTSHTFPLGLKRDLIQGTHS